MSDSPSSLDSQDFERLLRRSSLGSPDPEPSAGQAPGEPVGELPADLARRFAVVARLGGGGEAETLLVRQPDGRKAVLKVYHHVIPDAETRRVLGRVRSPHLVRLYAADEADGYGYELLEYVPGPTLANLARERMPTATIVELVRQLSEGLHALHEANIIHRDLKPANILVRSREPLQVALADYGLSQQLATEAAFSNSGVTLPYTAPESLVGHVSASRDWWSLGMIVVELATGRRPFEGLPPDFVAFQLASRAVDLSTIRDERLRVLCAGLLTRDPEYRWGFEQVRQWLAGYRPEVLRETGRGEPSSDTPTWVQCRAAAASIYQAEYGSEAMATVRPRSVLGIVRSRGPLSLLLYVAAIDGLLVWRGPDSLALLQPPGDRPRKPSVGGVRMTLLRRLARSWDTMIFGVPPAVLLVLAGVAAALVAAGSTAFAWPGLMLALAALIYVTVFLLCGAVNGLSWFYCELGRSNRAREVVTAEPLPGAHWTITLCHHVDGTPARHLLRRVQHTLERILTADLRQAAADLGVRVTDAAVTEQLVCLRGGATTETTREAVGAWSDRSRMSGPGRAFTVRASDYRADRAPFRVFDRGGFLFWYLAGEAVVIAVLAQMVPHWERAACATSCAGHPVTDGQAWRWLTQRLLLTDPYGLAPASRSAWAVGWLVSVMSLIGLLVVVAAARQYAQVRRAEIAAAALETRMVNEHTRTLIMVATAEEHRAVLAATAAVTGQQPESATLGNQVVWQLGTISATKLMLVQVEPGAVGPGSAAISAASLLSKLNPDFFIVVGIGYGLRPEGQEFGDILVCTQLRAIDHRKVAELPDAPPGAVPRSGAEAAALLRDSPPPSGEPSVQVRGDSVIPSVAMLSRLRAVTQSWTGPPAVHFGPMLSASMLVSSRSERDRLAAQHPDAIGGEMEGAGVYAAAAHAKVDWIVVKAISDFGFGKTDAFHERAARNAASFVIRAAELGFLDEAPRRGTL